MNKITVKEKYYHFTKDGKKKTKCVLELENMDKFEATLFGMNIIENNAFRGGKTFTKMRVSNKISATVTFTPGMFAADLITLNSGAAVTIRAFFISFICFFKDEITIHLIWI